MKNRKHYSRIRKQKIAFYVFLLIMAGLIGWMIGSTGRADDGTFTLWAVCQPGSHIDVHRAPAKGSKIEGWLDPCDSFTTDGVTKNGFYRVLDVGEGTEGWVYCGYVVAEEPKKLNGERYVSVSKGKLYCRRWISGPKIAGRAGYLKNCETCQVFYRTSEWCVTNRGYIRSEWLEVDPE